MIFFAQILKFVQLRSGQQEGGRVNFYWVPVLMGGHERAKFISYHNKVEQIIYKH
jgi:hypothetical protein